MHSLLFLCFALFYLVGVAAVLVGPTQKSFTHNSGVKAKEWGWLAGIGVVLIYAGTTVPATTGVCLVGEEAQPYQRIVERLGGEKLGDTESVVRETDTFYAGANVSQKRIQIENKLLEMLSPEGVVAVLAHEMAHLYIHGPHPLDSLPKTRSRQVQADLYGAELLEQIGWSSQGFEEVLKVAHTRWMPYGGWKGAWLNPLLGKTDRVRKRIRQRKEALEDKLQKGAVPVGPKDHQDVIARCRRHQM